MTAETTAFLMKVYRSGFKGVSVPAMALFRRIELRDLWFSGVLALQGSLAED